jgi:hypothetical protein
MDSHSKLALLLLIVSLLLSSIIFTEPIKADVKTPKQQWSITYPRQPRTVFDATVYHDDVANCFTQTSDGGYLIATTLEDHVYWAPHGGFERNSSEAIIKTDASGNLQWQKIVPYKLIALSQTPDSGILALTQWGPILKLDSQGNIVSNTTIGLSFTGMQKTADNNYLFVGADKNTAVIAKTDGNGNLLWNKTLFDFPNCYSSSVIISNIATASDGNYFIAGTSRECPYGFGEPPNLWLLNFNPNGNLLFNRSFNYAIESHEDPSLISSICAVGTNDGGCLIAGTGEFPILIKFASNGDWRWDRIYPYDVTYVIYGASIYSVIQTSDGGYLAVGGYHPKFENEELIFKTDAEGNIFWNQTISTGEIFLEAGSYVRITDDGGFAVIGSKDGNVFLEKFAPEQSSTPIPTLTLEPTPIPTSNLPTVLTVAAVLIITAVSLLLLYGTHKRSKYQNKPVRC